LLGRPLPKSALRDEPWWANVNKRPANLTPWDAAGWRVQAVYLTAKSVVFRRAGTDIATDIARTIKLLLEPRTAPPLLEANTVKGWLRWCTRNGWYFEGKTLYEQGHYRRETLNDTDLAEFEEDYSTCKRNSALPNLA